MFAAASFPDSRNHSAEAADHLGRVRHEDDRRAAPLEFAHALDALRLEAHVAHRQDLVDQKDVRIGAHRDREGEAEVHPRRVRLHRPVGELADVRERGDVGESCLEVGARQPDDRAAQVHVLPAGELPVETGAEFEERVHPAEHLASSGGRALRTGEDLEQRRLAGTVLADDPHRLAAPDRERHLGQRDDLRIGAPPAEDLLQPILRVAAERVALAEPLDPDRRLRGHRRMPGECGRTRGGRARRPPGWRSDRAQTSASREGGPRRARRGPAR